MTDSRFNPCDSPLSRLTVEHEPTWRLTTCLNLGCNLTQSRTYNLLYGSRGLYPLDQFNWLLAFAWPFAHGKIRSEEGERSYWYFAWSFAHEQISGDGGRTTIGLLLGQLPMEVSEVRRAFWLVICPLVERLEGPLLVFCFDIWKECLQCTQSSIPLSRRLCESRTMKWNQGINWGPIGKI